MFTLYLITKYQATNIAEAYLTFSHIQASKLFQNQDQMVSAFIGDAFSYACGKGYQVSNIEMFKEAVRVFFIAAETQYESILRKIESD
jgi:hypothetical protein